MTIAAPNPIACSPETPLPLYKETNFKESPIGKIPKEWNPVLLEEIAEVRRGASPRPIGDPSYFSETGRGWVRISDVTETYKYLRKTSQYLSKLGASKSVEVNQGDLIMSICATIGKPVLVDMEACIHDGFVVFKNLQKEVDKEFLFYMLQKYEGKFSGMKQTGTQGNLNTSLVGSTTIPLPPLAEQRAIVGVLGVVDSALDYADQIIAKCDRLKRGLMQQLLTRGIGHTETKQTPIGTIPKDWETVKLGDALEQCQYGLSVKFGEQGKYPILKMDDIVNGVAVPDKVKRVDLDTHIFSAFRLEKGDVLFNRTNSYEHVGRTGIFLLDGDYTFASYLIKLRPKKELIDSQFLTLYLIYAHERLKQLATIAVHQANINATNLRSFPIVLPPLTEQKKIAQIILTLDQKLGLENKERARLERIKKSLMDLLLTGKVRIKVD